MEGRIPIFSPTPRVDLAEVPVRSLPKLPPMNILMLFCDEMRGDVFGAMGHPHVKTPNLDRLAERSVVFPRVSGCCPVCMPSRTALATGRYPRVNGCMDNSTFAIEGEAANSLYPRFSDAGWRVENVGKIHVGWPLEENRFAHHESASDGFGPFGSPDPEVRRRLRLRRLRGNLPIVFAGESPVPADRTTAALTVDAGLRRLATYSRGEPFFLRVSSAMPHTPYIAPAPYATMYDPDEVDLPESWGDDIRTKPTLVQYFHRTRRYGDLTEEDVRHCRASYYGLISHVDAQIGRVLDALEESGLADETIVVFTSDHGTCLGEHGWIEKWAQFWRETLAMPFWISVPGGPRGRCEALVQQLDLAPTLYDLCGLETPEGVQGRSLAPLLEDPTRTHRDAVFAETFIPGLMNEPACMVRTDRWKLTDYPRSDEIEARLSGDDPLRWTDMFLAENLVGGELYDLAADPHETRNLIASPEHQRVLAQLRARLDDWKRECEPRAAWEDLLPPPGAGWSEQGRIEGDRMKRITEVFPGPARMKRR